jgi:hypothetical protein
MAPRSFPRSASVPQEYYLVVKTFNDAIEMWYTPHAWAGDDKLPAAHQSVPKEWIAYPRVECFIAPAFASNEGISLAQMIFGSALVGQSQLNPENPGGYVTVVTVRDEEYPEVQRSLALWEAPRKTHEQLNRRIAEIRSKIEPLNAKLANFLARYSNEEMVAITLGFAPVQSGCFKLWSMVLYHGGRRMTPTGKESPELQKEQAAFADILSALTWEHPREKTPDPAQWDPRTVMTEVAGMTDAVRTGRCNTLPSDIELIGDEIASLSDGWARNITFVVLSYDEARRLEPMVDSWIIQAEKNRWCGSSQRAGPTWDARR